jgi:hypothetical protein
MNETNGSSGKPMEVLMEDFDLSEDSATAGLAQPEKIKRQVRLPDTSSPAPPEPTAAVAVSDATATALFERYEAADKQMATLTAQIAAVQAERSLRIEAIVKVLGKGPFSWRGDELTIAKAKQGGYAFRVRSKRKVLSVG